jgi:hypothetical protein
MTDLEKAAAEIGVTPEVLGQNVSESEGVMIGKIIKMMSCNPRPSILLKLQEMVSPTVNFI